MTPEEGARSEEGEAHAGGRHYRRMLRHGATYGLGSLASRLAGFVLLPVYTRVIPAGELGNLYVVIAASAFLTTLLSLGVSSALFRFYFDATDARSRDRIVASGFVLVMACAACTLSLLWVSRSDLSQLLTSSRANAHLIDAMLLGVLFDVALLVPFGVLRAEERSIAFTTIGFARFLISISISIWLVVGRHMGAHGVLLATAATNAVIFAIVGKEAVGRLRVGASFLATRGLLRFGLPLMLATIGSILVDSSDQFLIQLFRGPEEVSIYGTGYRIAKILQVLFIQPFLLAWPAVMWSLAKRPEAHAVYARTLTYAVAGIAFAALGVSLFRNELIGVIATDAFLPAAWILPWVTFGLVLLLSTYVLNSGIAISGRTEYVAWTMAITVAVNVGLNLLLIPDHGMRGAAVSTFVAYAVMAGMMTTFSQRLHPIRYDWRRLSILVLLSLALTVLGLSLEHVPGLSGIALRVAVWASFALVVVSPLFMSRSERLGLTDVVARIRRRAADRRPSS